MKAAVFGAAIALALSVGGASAQYASSYGRSTYSGSSYGMTGTGSNPNNHYVAPHTNSDGSYVDGHYRTNPNSTQRDNYGTLGNYNPNTGLYGTRGARY
jgi:hypothetical protein